MPCELWDMLINFDFDGVIADTFDQLLQLCTAVQQEVGEGRAPVKDDFRTLENLTFEGLAARLGISRNRAEFVQTAILHQQNTQGPVHFYPGVANLLHKLGRIHTISIISASSNLLIRDALETNGVLCAVHSICGAEEGRSKKDSLLFNMEMFSTGPHHTIMVGDTINDIRQGRAAGVVTIGVEWGFQSRDLLLQEGPDHLISSPDELEKILDE